MQKHITEKLPLFELVASRTCNRCFDTGIWLTPRNEVEACPRVQCGEAHAEQNEASKKLEREAKRLHEMSFRISAQVFDLARLLTNFTTENPCPRQEIFDTFFGDTNLSDQSQLRKFHLMIEELRGDWLLPIGSRKDEPSGYWIITNLQDFKDWYKRATSAPVTQLSTIHKNARHNFPFYAEQVEFNFWKDMTDEN